MAVDPGVHKTGVALFEDGKIQFARCLSDNPLLELRDLIEIYKPNLFLYERSGGGKGFGAVRDMNLSKGWMQALCVAYHLPNTSVTPQAVKKAMCGRVNKVSKDEMIEAVEKLHFGILPMDDYGNIVTEAHHAADAVGVYYAVKNKQKERKKR
jgi:Holliday junction resolvasome RuvABC endonuclease subunit